MQQTRRRFLTRLGISGMGILGSTSIGLLLADKGRNEPVLVKQPQHIRDFHLGLKTAEGALVVARGDPVKATRAAIEALGGMSRFVKKGESVAVKPNIGWDRTPIQAANTNPLVVATIVELCLAAGASRVVVTDNPCNEAGRCFTRSGIWQAAERAGAEIVLPAKHRFYECDLGGAVLGRMPVLKPAILADRFINVPIAKHHGLCGLTGAMKNLYGVLGGRRNRLHQSIDQSIADLANFVRPTLTVMDATRVLLRNGPQGGNIADAREVGQVIASTDQVAVDAYAASLIERKYQDIPYLLLAEQRGLGIADLTKIKLREVS